MKLLLPLEDATDVKAAISALYGYPQAGISLKFGDTCVNARQFNGGTWSVTVNVGGEAEHYDDLHAFCAAYGVAAIVEGTLVSERKRLLAILDEQNGTLRVLFDLLDDIVTREGIIEKIDEVTQMQIARVFAYEPFIP